MPLDVVPVPPTKLIDHEGAGFVIVLGCSCGAAVEYPGHPDERLAVECWQCGQLFAVCDVDSLPRAANPIRIGDTLTHAGFVWNADIGYWWTGVAGGKPVELTLEPQVLNAGAFKLGLYRDGGAMLRGEVLVDVRPRPRP